MYLCDTNACGSFIHIHYTIYTVVYSGGGKGGKPPTLRLLGGCYNPTEFQG